MLLKDCPVGSFVRLVEWHGRKNHPCVHWRGEFEVKNDGRDNYVLDRDGDARMCVFDDANYQFEIVSAQKTRAMTITINGKTYKLKPHTEPRLTVIDGVTYEMEEI